MKVRASWVGNDEDRGGLVVPKTDDYLQTCMSLSFWAFSGGTRHKSAGSSSCLTCRRRRSLSAVHRLTATQTQRFYSKFVHHNITTYFRIIYTKNNIFFIFLSNCVTSTPTPYLKIEKIRCNKFCLKFRCIKFGKFLKYKSIFF